MLIGGVILAVVAGGVMKTVLWKGWRLLVRQILCALVMAVDLLLWHESIKQIGPGLATLLSNFQVFIMAGYSLLILRERITWNIIAGTLLAFAGFAALVLPELSSPSAPASYLTGVILALLTAVAYATYLILLRNARIDNSVEANGANMAMISLFTGAFMTIMALARDETMLVTNAQSITFLIVYGVLCQALAWVLIGTGMRRVSATLLGVILLIQPAFSYVWDMVFFHLQLNPLQHAGIVVSLAAIFLASVNFNKVNQHRHTCSFKAG